MSKRLLIVPVVFAALLAGAMPVFGQSVLQVSAVAAGQAANITQGGTLALTAGDIGQPVLANVTVTYGGTATAVITRISVTGTSEITLLASPTVPITLNPGNSASFTVQYLPSSGNAVASAVSILFSEGSQASSFQFTANGASPHVTFGYFFAPNGAFTDLTTAGITFPATNVGSTVQAVVTVLNRGSAAASLQSVSVSGATFQLTGSPAPAQLAPGQQASFTVTFAPPATGGSQGLLSLGFATSSAAFTLAGIGTSVNFAVSYTLANGNIIPITSGTAISFPPVDVNGSTTATITILNQGTGSGTVTSATVSGAGFQLSGLPLLPAVVPVGQSLRFGIVFTPTQPGTSSGSFNISVAGATISGTLIGSTSAPNFSATYSIGNASPNSLSTGSVISFPSVDVNGTSTATVTILNQGAGAGTITGISVSGAGFQLSGAPPLPANIPAGQSKTFGIVFTPTQAGSFNGTFSINLSGTLISGSLTGATAAPNFSASYTFANQNIFPLSNGGTITFPSVDVNTTTSVSITVLNQGAGSGTVTGIFVGGNGYTLASLPLLPATVPAGQNLKFGINFTAQQAGTFNGTFRIDLNGTSISGSLTVTTAPSKISLAYLDPDNNTISLPGGSTLQFPGTLSGSSSVVTVLVTNNGTGSGLVNSVTIGGAATGVFQLVSLPPLPLSVPPSQQARFGIRFSPPQQQSFTGSLVMDINGQILTVNVAGQGTGPQYTYSVISGGNTTALQPEGTLAIADTAVGQSSSVTVSVTNTGNGDGQISSIGVSGQGFSLAGLPAGPFILHGNGSQQFTVNFAPVDPGAAKGRLTIGSDGFNVTGTGIGSKLLYTYTNSASTNPVIPGGTIIFVPSAVGASNSVTFSIQNTGTTATTITSISLGTTSSIFALQSPSLPVSLNPGATTTVGITFLPNNTGPVTATLLVDTNAFVLSGTGTPPPSLPAYQFQGPSGNQQPAQQVSVGLSLASPYALPLRGTLTLTFISSVFTDDAAIQFANGSRTVNFTIAANSTQALFNGNTTVPLQTGTTAGSIVITPSFAVQSGFDVTPATPDTFTLTIARGAPQLVGASVTSETLNSFSVILSGYSTTRSLRQLDIQITPKQGSSFSTTHLTIDLSSTATAWFQGTQAFGGSFLMTIPFNLQNGSTTDDLVHLLQSLSITATNDVGASSALSVAIP